MGALHAAPMDAERDSAGVLILNCTLMEYCGCPGEPMIPWYLILGGCLTITLLVLRVVIIRVSYLFIFSYTCIISSQCCACKLVFLTIYDILALVMTILWLIAGTKFVMSLHERKNYATHNPNQDTCDWGLYWFSFVLLVCGWVSVILTTLYCTIARFCHCLHQVICCKKY